MRIVLFFFTAFFLFNSNAQTLEEVRDKLMKQYNPQGYQNLKLGEGIINKGREIAKNLSDELSNYQTLVTTSNPDELLKDFNQKMQEIENLEEQYVQQSNEFGLKQGQQLANQIKSGDTNVALANTIGTFKALSQMKEAQRELEEQKAALQKERHQKMSQIFWKAYRFNENTQKNYLRLAAFAEDHKDEQYNLNFVENLKCFASSMEARFNSTNTAWLINPCPQPQKPVLNTIENKFVARDIQLSNVATRKFEIYRSTGIKEFREGAISYAAAASKLKPTAKYFYQLGEYYNEESTILSLSTLLTAKQLDANYFDATKNRKLEETKKQAEDEINQALRRNDNDYLKAFLQVGLDRTIRINGESILAQAIKLDQPDAMQLILNSYIENLSQTEVTKRLQKTVMLCVVQNSTACLQRFVELGVDLDFSIDNISPIDLSIKSQALDSYEFLISRTAKKSLYDGKYAKAPIVLLAKAKSDPSQASNLLNGLSGSDQIVVIRELLNGYKSNPTYFDVLEAAIVVIPAIKGSTELTALTKAKFLEEVMLPSPQSKAHRFIKCGLLEFETIPLVKDLRPENDKTGQFDFSKDPYDISFKLEEIVSHNSKYSSYDGSSKITIGLFEPSLKCKTGINTLVELQNKLSNLSYEDVAWIDGTFAEIVMNYWNVNRREKYYKYLSKYWPLQTITTDEKLKFLRKDVQGICERSKLKDPDDATIQTILKSNFQILSQLVVLNREYVIRAIHQRQPLDATSLSFFSASGYKLCETVTDNESIALAAFIASNHQLFQELDKKFDLSKVRNGNGEELLTSMVKGFTPLASNKAFYSKDFDVNKIIDGQLVWKLVIINSINSQKQFQANNIGYLNNDMMVNSISHPIQEFLSSYGKDVNEAFTQSNGTLLHWAIESIIQNKENYSSRVDILNHLIISDLIIVSSVGIDKLKKDDNGLTALDFYKKHESDFKTFYKDRALEFYEEDGATGAMVNKGASNLSWKRLADSIELVLD